MWTFYIIVLAYLLGMGVMAAHTTYVLLHDIERDEKYVAEKTWSFWFAVASTLIFFTLVYGFFHWIMWMDGMV